MTQSDILLKHLSTVFDPELGANIVELGMVKKVDHEGSTVKIDLALTIADCPMRSQIEKEITRKLTLLENVETVEINVVAMDQKDRTAVMEKARKKARENAQPTKIDPRTRVIAIGSGKGGVGKSTLSTNIALGLSKKGFKTGLLDADIWGFSIPQMLGVDGRLAGNEETKKIVPLIKNVGTGTLKIISMGFLVDENKASLNWRGLILNRAVRHFLEDVEWGDMDYLVIDMPPGTGDVQMGLAKMLPRSDMIVVTTPSKTVQTVATRVASMAQSYYLRIAGVIENMSAFINEEGNYYEIFGTGGGENLAQELGVPLLGSIPIDPFVSNGSDSGVPVILGEGHAAESLNLIVDEVLAAVPKVNPIDCTAHGTLETSVTISNN